MSVVLEDGSVGNFTQAISSPVEESNFSISWKSWVVPSEAVKIKSVPSELFTWVKSESVNETNTGKFDKSDEMTVFNETVILFLYSHKFIINCLVKIIRQCY